MLDSPWMLFTSHLDTEPKWPDLAVVRNHVLGCNPRLNEDEADETTRFHHACRRHDGRLAARPRAQQRATHRESASSGLAIRGPLMNPGDGVNVAVRSKAGICCISDVILDRYTVTPTKARDNSVFGVISIRSLDGGGGLVVGRQPTATERLHGLQALMIRR
jgi:hypothetical protein